MIHYSLLLLPVLFCLHHLKLSFFHVCSILD